MFKQSLGFYRSAICTQIVVGSMMMMSTTCHAAYRKIGGIKKAF